MKKNYTHISYEERIKIDTLFNVANKNMHQIAILLNVSPNTISREFKLGCKYISKKGYFYYRHNNKCRLYGQRHNKIYIAKHAQNKAEKRHENSIKQLKIKNNFVLKQTIINYLIKGYKPDVISGRLKIDYPNDKNYHISKETIYNWLYNTVEGQRYVYLLQKGNNKQRKKRKKQALKKAQRIKNRISIHNRPNTIDIFGHFEGDSIVSKNHSSGEAIHTEVERKTKLLFAYKIKSKTADDTIKTMIDIFKPIKNIVKSITLDNGLEFSKHYKINKLLDIQTYFADPYSSWQRGCNERHNGLLRRFIPKKIDLNTVSQKELNEYVYYWNNMPRKCLNYKTPLECWNIEINKLKKKKKHRLLL